MGLRTASLLPRIETASQPLLMRPDPTWAVGGTVRLNSPACYRVLGKAPKRLLDEGIGCYFRIGSDPTGGSERAIFPVDWKKSISSLNTTVQALWCSNAGHGRWSISRQFVDAAKDTRGVLPFVLKRGS